MGWLHFWLDIRGVAEGWGGLGAGAVGVWGWVGVWCLRDAPYGASVVFRAVLYLSSAQHHQPVRAKEAEHEADRSEHVVIDQR